MSLSETSATVSLLRRKTVRYRRRAIGFFLTLLAAAFVVTLAIGQSFTPLGDVLAVLLGNDVSGASFTVGELRMPRAVLSILAGMCFGLGGVTFQTLLRNPLASPDIIGISAGASAAAVFCIVVFAMNGPAVSLVAVVAGIGVAFLIYLLSWRGGMSGTRLILIGIGVDAMLDSFIAYILLRAPSWSMQEAMRWLSGSVNGARLDQVLPLAAALLVFGGTLLVQQRNLETLRIGDDAAAGLGIPVGRVRAVLIIAAVGLVSVATAATGPIAFVAFLSGPVAARLVGKSGSSLIPAALTGAVLVLVCDFIGQHVLPARYPVGIVTGILGAPYLLFLITRVNRQGGSS